MSPELSAISTIYYSYSAPIIRLIFAAIFAVAGLIAAVAAPEQAYLPVQEGRYVIRGYAWAIVGLVIAIAFLISYWCERQQHLIFLSATGRIAVPTGKHKREFEELFSRVRLQQAALVALRGHTMPQMRHP